MATQAIRLRAEPLRSLAAASIGTSYTALGDPLVNPARIIHLQNATNADIVWSMDGINDHGFLAAGAFILLDITANKSLDQGEFIAIGTQFYVDYPDTQPTTGAVYLSVFFGAIN
jgi:hypothetical protein